MSASSDAGITIKSKRPTGIHGVFLGFVIVLLVIDLLE